ncbi:endonuclease 8-like 1 isoform X3 [Nomascus leucogenys]|uniref:endonuclease 8-like 1 isoform X3 n=1 Tax=Nomascus leucogenys TaxID=61853 RepID=UPI00122D938C|nr:endonuclease 8-like 1 isoform X3 [Nomascus leucogenys]
MGFGALKRRGVRINRGQGRSGGMGRMGPRAPLLPRTRIWSLTFSRKTSPMGARPGAAPRCGGGKVRASAFAKCPLPLKAHLRLRFRTARGDRTLPPSLRMPEGPELHLASQFVNEACRALVFGGCVEKSSVSRNPEVPFESSAYRISASARGKELRLILSPLPGAQPPQEPLALVFRFGMSGSFQLVPREELPRHAHLRFYTAPSGPRLALCFVDIRRFGRWELGGKWQPGRGPCVLQEYQQFRENVLRNLADKAFDRPICEALLDQRFFNGIGNYLRAEILYRLKIPPFEKARSVLEALQQRRPSPELTLSQKIRTKLQNPDLLELCHSVPKEVVQLGGKGYGSESGEEDFAAFRAWLRCYGMPGMSSLQDRHGRTIWFQGASPAKRNPRPQSQVLRTEWRTLRLQARPLPGHEGQRETFLRGLQPSGLRGPASSRTQKLPQCPRRGGGRGDRQPLAIADPGRSRLTPHPWNRRRPQPLSRRVSLPALTLSYCLALNLGGLNSWEQAISEGANRPYSCSLHNSHVFNCTPSSTSLKLM